MRKDKKKASDLCTGQKPSDRKHGHKEIIQETGGIVNDEYLLLLLQEEIMLARIECQNLNWQSGHYC